MHASLSFQMVLVFGVDLAITQAVAAHNTAAT
jgi:hypothetical protein